MRRSVTTGFACLALGLAAVAAPARADSYSVLYAFQGGQDGAEPHGGLALAYDGAGKYFLLGTTFAGGGSSRCREAPGGCGTIFTFNPANNAETVVHSFAGGLDGAHPAAGLFDNYISSSAGHRYFGTTQSGGRYGRASCPGGCGTVYTFDPATDTEQVVHSFDFTDGAAPMSPLVRISDGMLYGTTASGGASGLGTVYSLSREKELHPEKETETVVHSFQGGSDGQNPVAGLDKRYGVIGTTLAGGTKTKACPEGCGTVFSLGGVLHAFAGDHDGATPVAPLAEVRRTGFFIGTTLHGGHPKDCPQGCGTVYGLDAANGTVQVLYEFRGGKDGALPAAGVIVSGRWVYGTTLQGGGSTACDGGCGTVFAYDYRHDKYRVLHAFQGGSDGSAPAAPLLALGMLYGTTTAGGTGFGTIFAVSPPD